MTGIDNAPPTMIITDVIQKRLRKNTERIKLNANIHSLQIEPPKKLFDGAVCGFLIATNLPPILSSEKVHGKPSGYSEYSNITILHQAMGVSRIFTQLDQVHFL